MVLLYYTSYNIWVISFHIKNPIKTQIVQYKFYMLVLFLIPTANNIPKK